MAEGTGKGMEDGREDGRGDSRRDEHRDQGGDLLRQGSIEGAQGSNVGCQT